MFLLLILGISFLATSVVAKPFTVRASPHKLSHLRRMNSTGVRNVLRNDQARAQHLRLAATGQQTGGAFPLPIDNEVFFYDAPIGIGSPARTYNLLLDSGSGFLIVGAGNNPYVPTSTSVNTGQTTTVQFGGSSCPGTVYDDLVTLAPGLAIPGQPIIVVGSGCNLGSGVDGILGIGPTDLTQGQLNTGTVPTVVDTAWSDGFLAAYEVGLSQEPTNSTSSSNGEIMWGGIDSSRITGSLTYTPITTTFPSSMYWGFNQGITYGTSTTVLAQTAGIVDTGTTLILIATNAFNTYTAATGAVLDSVTGLLKITSSQFANLKSLFFHVNGASLELTPNGQIWPRALNTFIGGSTGSIYLIVTDIGNPSGSGLDFINGMVFLERFYAVLDTGNSRVGFAETPYTFATTN